MDLNESISDRLKRLDVVPGHCMPNPNIPDSFRQSPGRGKVAAPPRFMPSAFGDSNRRSILDRDNSMTEEDFKNFVESTRKPGERPLTPRMPKLRRVAAVSHPSSLGKSTGVFDAKHCIDDNVGSRDMSIGSLTKKDSSELEKSCPEEISDNENPVESPRSDHQLQSSENWVSTNEAFCVQRGVVPSDSSATNRREKSPPVAARKSDVSSTPSGLSAQRQTNTAEGAYLESLNQDATGENSAVRHDVLNTPSKCKEITSDPTNANPSHGFEGLLKHLEKPELSVLNQSTVCDETVDKVLHDEDHDTSFKSPTSSDCAPDHKVLDSISNAPLDADDKSLGDVDSAPDGKNVAAIDSESISGSASDDTDSVSGDSDLGDIPMPLPHALQVAQSRQGDADVMTQPIKSAGSESEPSDELSDSKEKASSPQPIPKSPRNHKAVSRRPSRRNFAAAVAAMTGDQVLAKKKQSPRSAPSKQASSRSTRPSTRASKADTMRDPISSDSEDMLISNFKPEAGNEKARRKILKSKSLPEPSASPGYLVSVIPKDNDNVDVDPVGIKANAGTSSDQAPLSHSQQSEDDTDGQASKVPEKNPKNEAEASTRAESSAKSNNSTTDLEHSDQACRPGASDPTAAETKLRKVSVPRRVAVSALENELSRTRARRQKANVKGSDGVCDSELAETDDQLFPDTGERRAPPEDGSSEDARSLRKLTSRGP
eukprot:Rmarinus@m.4779